MTPLFTPAHCLSLSFLAPFSIPLESIPLAQPQLAHSSSEEHCCLQLSAVPRSARTYPGTQCQAQQTSHTHTRVVAAQAEQKSASVCATHTLHHPSEDEPEEALRLTLGKHKQEFVFRKLAKLF